MNTRFQRLLELLKAKGTLTAADIEHITQEPVVVRQASIIVQPGGPDDWSGTEEQAGNRALVWESTGKDPCESEDFGIL